MSEIDIINDPPINKLINVENGLCQAMLSMKTLSIRQQNDGTVSMLAVQGDNSILFNLDKTHIAHLVDLLIAAQTPPENLQESIESIKSKVEKSVLYSISADPGGTILLTIFENGQASGIELSQGMLKQMVKELSRYVR